MSGGLGGNAAQTLKDPTTVGELFGEESTPQPDTSRRESTQPRTKTSKAKVMVDEEDLAETSTAPTNRRESTQSRKKSSKPKPMPTVDEEDDFLPDTQVERPPTGRRESAQGRKKSSKPKPKPTSDEEDFLPDTNVERPPASRRESTQSRKKSSKPKSISDGEEDFLLETNPNPASRRESTQNRKRSSKPKTANQLPPDEDDITVAPRSKKKRKKSIGSNFASDDEAPEPAPVKKTKTAIQAPTNEDGPAYTPRGKNKKKRKLSSNFASDDEGLAPPPPPPQVKAPKRKKRIEASEGEDEDEDVIPRAPSSPPPKRKRKVDSKRKKQSQKDDEYGADKASEKSKESDFPAVSLTNPYQLPTKTQAGVPKNGAAAPTPAIPSRKPYPVQQPAGNKTANEAIRDSSRPPEDLFVPSDRRGSVAQSPSIWTTARAPSAQAATLRGFTRAPSMQPTPLNRFTPTDARASVSREFGQAYHTLPTTATHVNQQDFDRTALFQLRHREQEASGAESVGIGLPASFVPASGYRAESAASSVPDKTVPGNRQSAEPGNSGSQQQAPAAGQDDWVARFGEWANSAEGVAVFSGISGNGSLSDTQPQQVGSTGQEEIDQYSAELGRVEKESERRQQAQSMSNTPAPAVDTAPSPPTQAVNGRSNSVQPARAEAPAQDPMNDFLDALGDASQKVRNNVRSPQNMAAPLNVQGDTEEAHRRQRGLSSSSSASVHSAVTQGSHSHQRSESTASDRTSTRMPAQSPLDRASVAPSRTPTRTQVQPSAAPMLRRMGGDNINTFDGAGDFSVQPQQRPFARGPGLFTPDQKMSWSQWNNVAGSQSQQIMAGYQSPFSNGMSVNPFISAPPQMLPQQGFGVPVQASRMARSVSNGSSQGSTQQRGMNGGAGQTTMPPPASPMQAASRSFQDPASQARRDSILSAYGLPNANSPPILLSQYPPQQASQRGFSVSPPRMAIPMPNGLPSIRTVPSLPPFIPGTGTPVVGQQASYHAHQMPGSGLQGPGPSTTPQRSPVQQSQQQARTPPQNTQPHPSTPQTTKPALPNIINNSEPPASSPRQEDLQLSV
ncbi:hypothetical protein M409DRAFT_15656 [Zasmidium cellare ATCC 36951]|uniref:Uncharacterized protein n=1 Tax=Zasmidium cellare ATCC 36951 TaxID=1080233 RepID=A0A6A6D1Y2_ZASCE|nr:uncharacterized protein M409DRAFT_15656 [Zasmidium cellare ATCC 36951]KAF2173371.1 hypothetical protein M409DRAFT_15656 [Zasmidium cellare ATCC 36951]